MRTPMTLLASVLLLGASSLAAQTGGATPNPNPKIPTGAWAAVLRDHPRLAGPTEYLKQLAKANPQAWQRAKGAQGALADGVKHAVDGLPAAKVAEHIAAAMNNLDRGVTNEHQDTWIWLDNVALVFDFFHDQIPQADRQKMIAWFNAHLDKFTADEGAFHNSTLSKVLCYLRIAYATWNENPRAKDFRDYALLKLYEGKLLPVLRQFGTGGGYTECGWYTRGSLWHLVQALELARRIEKYDGFALAPQFFYHRLAYEMLQPYPGLWTYGTERFAVEGDGSDLYGGHTEYPRHTRMVLGQYFRGSELARYVVNKHRKPSNPEAALVDFLYDQELDQPLPINTFPLAHLADGIGKVYARSDWTDDATWFRFECGDFWNAHQHYEVGNFEIYRYSPLATESGEYKDYGSNHSVNWLIRTIAHNCILVYQPDETWDRQRDGGKNHYANDGGQTKKWEWTVDNLAIWNQRRQQFERGNILAYENRPEFMFVAADCTNAYAPSKLAACVRQIVFVRPHAFVIMDRVETTRPEYEKTWLVHCRQEPEIAGNLTTITNAKGTLSVQTLLPANAKIAAVKGYTYAGQTFDETKSALSDVANLWRLEVKPATPRTDDLFVHLLRTDGPAVGKVLQEGGKTVVEFENVQVVFAGNTGGTIKVAGKTLPLRPAVIKGNFE